MASRSKASRSAAAKKAAATRKRNANKRSAAAKKAAATRKRNASKGKRKATRSTKASRSAAAKKAAATRKRNASKRSSAAKKAAATRKRNASKGKRKSTRSTTKRSTKASRSAAAKKAAATRKRNANKRKAAAKKAAATRKRNASKGKRKSVKSKSRPTAAKRRAAAKKAAATRKRNANKRSRAAKKAAATRKRNAGKRKGRKGSRKARKVGVAKQGKSLYDSFMKGTDMLVPGMVAVGTALVGMGLYNSIKSMAWDRFNVTGSSGYIQQAADMIPVITPNMAADLGNFGNKALHTGSVAALGYLLSSKKALDLIDSKLAMSVVKLTGLYYSAVMLSELQTYSLGTVFSNLAVGDFSGAMSAFGSGQSPSMTYGTLGMAHGNAGMNNMGMYHVGGGHMGSVTNKKFFGAHNAPMLLPQNVAAPTAATQNTAGMGKAFFGTRGLGSSRVNLF